MKKEKIQPVGYATDEQIEAWKKKYNLKSIPEVIVEDEAGDEHAIYVRKPDFSQLQLLADSSKKDGEIIALNKVVKSLFIGGDNEVLEDVTMGLAAGGLIVEKYFKKKNATLSVR